MEVNFFPVVTITSFGAQFGAEKEADPNTLTQFIITSHL